MERRAAIQREIDRLHAEERDITARLGVARLVGDTVDDRGSVPDRLMFVRHENSLIV